MAASFPSAWTAAAEPHEVTDADVTRYHEGLLASEGDPNDQARISAFVVAQSAAPAAR